MESIKAANDSSQLLTNRRIALVGGGTAGHVYPALAIADTYRRVFGNVNLHFLGTSVGFESRLVPTSGYPFTLVPGAPLFGVGLQGKLRAIWVLIRGITVARHLLRTSGIKLVIGLGGYASAGVLLAARSLGLRTVIHESNIVPGLTNRFLGRFVDRVYLGFEAASWAFPKSKTWVTGNPVRSEIIAVQGEHRSRSPHPGHPFRILVTGGSQGAPFLNRHVPDLLRRVAGRGLQLEVWHQTGDDDPELVRAAYAEARLCATVTPYIDAMATAYQWADFAISRSGAGSIAELAACGLPALLVPLPSAANDHQTVNAVAYAAAGGGWCMRQAAWEVETLAARLITLSDPNAWMSMSQAASSVATPDAAHTLVTDCEAMMAGRW